MLLDRRAFLVKERVALVKLTDTYDLFDAESGVALGLARDEPAPWAKWARLLVQKGFLPTTIRVYEREGAPPVITLQKRPGFLSSAVVVRDAQGMELGTLRSKKFSIGGGFWVLDTAGNEAAEVKGDWKGWNFRLLDTGGRELGTVTKKWAGLGKELLTSADNYVVSLAPGAAGSAKQAALLLAAGLAIDMVFKEAK